MEDKEKINNKRDFFTTIESHIEAFKKHDIPISPPIFNNILPQGETKQDKLDWLYLIHNEEYDNHPLIKIIDTLIIILGYSVDFIANIGNCFIERKIKKKFMKRPTKRKLRKLALGRLGL